MRFLSYVFVRVLALVGLGSLLAGAWLLRDGVSARTPPNALETRVARQLRSLAIPADVRLRTNPEPQTAEALQEAMAHFADHCATCHGNDGSGDVPMGRAMYPRPPDMRQPETQRLSDGELFYIIEEGVKLTGMPGWRNGTSDGARASWNLVQFIRHLPALTSEEVETMRGLNPRGPDEWRDEEETRKFLEGAGPAAAPPASAPHEHSHEHSHEHDHPAAR